MIASYLSPLLLETLPENGGSLGAQVKHFAALQVMGFEVVDLVKSDGCVNSDVGIYKIAALEKTEGDKSDAALTRSIYARHMTYDQILHDLNITCKQRYKQVYQPPLKTGGAGGVRMVAKGERCELKKGFVANTIKSRGDINDASSKMRNAFSMNIQEKNHEIVYQLESDCKNYTNAGKISSGIEGNSLLHNNIVSLCSLFYSSLASSDGKVDLASQAVAYFDKSFSEFFRFVSCEVSYGESSDTPCLDLAHDRLIVDFIALSAAFQSECFSVESNSCHKRGNMKVVNDKSITILKKLKDRKINKPVFCQEVHCSQSDLNWMESSVSKINIKLNNSIAVLESIIEGN